MVRDPEVKTYCNCCHDPVYPVLAMRDSQWGIVCHVCGYNMNLAVKMLKKQNIAGELSVSDINDSNRDRFKSYK